MRGKKKKKRVDTPRDFKFRFIGNLVDLASKIHLF